MATAWNFRLFGIENCTHPEGEVRCSHSNS